MISPHTGRWLALLVAVTMVTMACSTAAPLPDRHRPAAASLPPDGPLLPATPVPGQESVQASGPTTNYADLGTVTSGRGQRPPLGTQPSRRTTSQPRSSPVPSPSLLPPVKVELVWAIAAAPEVLRRPIAVGADKQGHLYVLDAGTNHIVKFDSGGQAVTRWGSEGGDAGQFRFRPAHRCDDSGDQCAPEVGGGIAVDGEGRVYVADYGNHRVQVFDGQGRLLTGWGREGDGPGELRLPSGIVVDERGHVWVSDTANHRVQQFDPAGQFLGLWGGRGTAAGRLVHPRALAVDAEEVVVADLTDRGQRFDRQGHVLGRWLTADSGGEGLPHAAGMAIDYAGHIYVVDTGAGIQKRDRRGQVRANWRGDWRGEGQLHSPAGIAVDERGDLYVADQGSGQIHRFRQLLPTVR